MKQTMLLKLAPSPEQSNALLATLHAFNAACNRIAETAFAQRLANKFELQKLVYADIRKEYGLSSQLTIRAISKVVDSYKRDKSIKPTETLGVDLGIVNLATDSTGETFSGEQVEKTRQRMHALRQRLQKRGTKSAKRHLKKLSGKEARFRKNTNHVISKRLVHKAKANHQGIAIEELRHIRQRTQRTVRRSQRSRHSSWSFAQLRFAALV